MTLAHSLLRIAVAAACACAPLGASDLTDAQAAQADAVKNFVEAAAANDDEQARLQQTQMSLNSAQMQLSMDQALKDQISDTLARLRKEAVDIYGEWYQLDDKWGADALQLANEVGMINDQIAFLQDAWVAADADAQAWAAKIPGLVATVIAEQIAADQTQAAMEAAQAARQAADDAVQAALDAEEAEREAQEQAQDPAPGDDAAPADDDGELPSEAG